MYYNCVNIAIVSVVSTVLPMLMLSELMLRCPFTNFSTCSTLIAQSVDDSMCFFSPIYLLAAIVGHVGDGNFHSILMIDYEDKEEVQKVKDFGKRMAQ